MCSRKTTQRKWVELTSKLCCARILVKPLSLWMTPYPPCIPLYLPVNPCTPLYPLCIPCAPATPYAPCKPLQPPVSFVTTLHHSVPRVSSMHPLYLPTPSIHFLYTLCSLSSSLHIPTPLHSAVNVHTSCVIFANICTDYTTLFIESLLKVLFLKCAWVSHWNWCLRPRKHLAHG